MNLILTFSDRQAFREWLAQHGSDHEGVWLVFGKKGGPQTLTAAEALEEALCHGWIDGQMQSMDSACYHKYFARRTEKSNWSDKNKKLAQALIEQGLMTSQGMEAILQAKKNGAWEAPARLPVDEEQVEAFKLLIAPHEPAYSHLLAMSPSVQRTYTGFYLDAKSDQTRKDRLAKIIGRLHQNLKPM